ncbi:MAG: ROK family protein [Erysipelotrichaceae bacterium]|nr:ROK family protein [Erysipelotrichaceae bacterium]
MKKILCCDFGGTLVKSSIRYENGDVLSSSTDVSPTLSKQSYIDFLLHLYQQNKEVDGIALSMPGVIDSKIGTLITSGTYVHLVGMNVKREFEKLIPIRIEVENDGCCAVLAEHWKGNLQDADNGVAVILGTGIAGGIIINGKLYKGSHLSAGDFSTLLLGEHNDFSSIALMKCGISTMVFEASRRLGVDLKKNPNYPLYSLFLDCEQMLSDMDHRFPNGFDGYAFFELLNEGNEICEEIYSAFLDALVRLIFNIGKMFDPQKICLGGGVMAQERIMTDVMKKMNSITDFGNGLIDLNFTVERCRFTNDSNQLGALYHFLNMGDKV